MNEQSWSTMDFLRAAKVITDGAGFHPGSNEYFEDYFGRVRTMMEEQGFSVDAPLVVFGPPPVDPYLGAPLETAPGPACLDVPAPVHVAPEIIQAPASPGFDLGFTAAAPATPAGEDASGVDPPNAGNERIKCPHSGCPTELKNQASLTTHLTNHHAAKDGNSCYICDGTFRNESTLRLHLKDHHKVKEGKLKAALEACGGLKSVDIKWLQPRFDVDRLIKLLDKEMPVLEAIKDSVREKYRQLDPPAQARLERIQQERMQSANEPFYSRQHGMDQMELIRLLIKVRKESRAWNKDLEEIEGNMTKS